MKKTFTILIAAIAAILMMNLPVKAWADNNPDVTYDFTGSDWTVSNGTLSNGTVSFTGAGGTNFKMNSGYFIMGKSGAYLNFPTYSSAVSKIVITGNSGASESVVQNIYVGDNAVSTATTGATGTNTYNIASTSQTAGTQYTLKVTSNHNTQITKIEIYYASGGGATTGTTTTVTVPEGFKTNINDGTNAGTLSAAVTVTEGGASVEGATVTWSSTNENVATIASNGAVTLVASGKVKFRATYAGDNTTYVGSYGETAEMTITNTNPNANGGVNDPYTVAEARSAIDANAGVIGVYVTGIVSQIVTDYEQANGYISYNISTDGLTTSNQLQVYRGTCNDGDIIRVGDEVVVTGNLTKWSSTYEFEAGSTLQSLKLVAPTFNPAEGSVVSGTEVTITNLHTGATIYYTTGNGDPNTAYNGAITINEATTIKAKAVKDGYTPSEIVSVAYSIAQPVATPQIQPAGGSFSAAQNVSISTTTDGATIYYTTNGSEPTTSSSVYSAPINVKTDMTIRAIAVKDGMANSGIASATFDFYAGLPFSWTSSFGTSPIGVTNNGVSDGNGYLKFDTNGDNIILRINARPGTLSFDVKGNPSNNVWAGTCTVETSTNGTEWSSIASYDNISTSSYDSKSIDLGESVRYIKWTYSKTTGNLAMKNISLSAYVAPSPSIAVDPAIVNTTAAGANGTVAVTYSNFESFPPEVWFCNSDGSAYASYSWVHTSINGDNNVAYTIDANDGDARHAYFKVKSGEIASEIVTINQAAYVAPTHTSNGDFIRISSLDLLTDGCKVVIAARYDEDHTNGYYAMQNTASGKPEGVSFTSTTTVESDEILPSTIAGSAYISSYYWTVSISIENNKTYYTFTNTANPAQSIGYSSGTNFSSASNTTWTIERSTSEETAMVGEYTGFVIKNVDTNTRGFAFNGSAYGAYATSNMTGSGYNFFLDLFVQTYSLPITGCGDDAGGYYLIASPVALDIAPSTANGFITGNSTENRYDLYRFNQSSSTEWENYKVGDGFNIVSGKGYLYASESGTTLTFTGQPYNGDGVVSLTYDGNAPHFAGWNLIGNPYNTTAYLADSRDFYRMNPAGTGIIAATDNAIALMEGIFVQAANADDESVTFTTTNPNAKSADSRIVLNLVGNNDNVIDRAIVRFNDRKSLSKLLLHEDNTNIYILQDSKKFAIVQSNGKADMPVNFKAKEMGKYTISVNTEGIDMDYLHLIDRLTGEDVNLLLDNSYSFVASAQDVESRFILSFTATGYNADADEPFAYQNGSEIIVNGEGELQIFDVTGRQIMTTTINGIESVNVSAKGVLILRLVGTEVKTQKMVVR